MQDLRNTIHGVVIDYELLGRILEAKQHRINNPDDRDKSRKVLAICKTVYPDNKTH